MQWAVSATVLALVGAAVASGDEEHTWRLGKDDAGKLPAGWKADSAGSGTGSLWKVVEDDTAPSRAGYVLAQTAASPKAFISLCVADETLYRDVGVSVLLKAVRGTIHRGGGVVWRYQDNQNYYLARVDFREDSFCVYKVVKGRCIELASKDDPKVPEEEWHTLKVEMSGDHIACSLDATEQLDVRDSSLCAAGQAGLWTKGDARTYFDDFRARSR